MDYRHTQYGYAAPFVIVFLLGVLIAVILSADDEPGLILGTAAFMAFVSVVVLAFNRLTVTVAGGGVTVAFAWGWPKRSIDVLDIAGFRAVRNKWYYGWGIRKVPGGWMYNVWGLDAVELELRSGKKFRIGTNQPADLIAALALHTSIRPGES